MGKYLEDRKLDSVLETYFSESVEIQKPIDGKTKIIYNIIEKNKKVIEKEVNKICKDVFNYIKSQIKSNNSFKREFEKMIQSGEIPYLFSIKIDDANEYAMFFYYSSLLSMDGVLFFEDILYKELRKSSILTNLGLNFTAEDYPGIYVYLKK